MNVNPFTEIYNELNAPHEDEHYFSYPICIDVELTNYCNLRCMMCPTGIGASVRDKGFMSDSVYYKLLRDISGHRTGLRFIRWGEPTLHPKMCEYIAAAKSDGHLCHMNTNGITLTGGMIEELLRSGLDSIKFSFQGVDEGSYEQMRQGGSFSTLVSNIEKLHGLRVGGKPYIYITTTIVEGDEAKIPGFIKMISGFCDSMNVGYTMFDHLDIGNSGLDEAQKALFSELQQRQNKNKQRVQHCAEVFGKLSVDWDGKVTACCTDYDCEMYVGDINTDTVQSIFNNDNINRYRDAIRNKLFDTIPKCHTCYNYMSYPLPAYQA